jgi:transposase
MGQSRERRKQHYAAHTYYLSGHTLEQCRDHFGIGLSTLKGWSSKEGWKAERDQVESDARQSLDQSAKSEALEETKSRIRRDDELIQDALQTIAEAKGDIAEITDPRLRVAARRDLAVMTDRLVRLRRESRGLKTGDASEKSQFDELPTQIRIVKTVVRPPADNRQSEKA